MDDHQLKSSLQCEDEVRAAQEQGSDTQLQFGFLEGGQGQDERGCAKGRSHQVPKRSKRELRAQHPGRDLRVTAVSRPHEEMQLERAIASHLPPGKSLRLRLTENRYTIISVQRGQHGYRVRTHRMFAGVEPRLVRALARYVAHNDQRASNLLGEFIDRNKHQIASEPRRKRRLLLRTRGQHHDLSAVFDRLNRAYFAGTHDARITWGIARRPANRRSIKVGSYSVEDRLIRIHPALDQEGVPGYFVNWIVFHEMLHGKHTIRRVGGRRCYHPPEFAEEERHLPDYQRARLWEKTHMDRLLGR
jgi:predicted metal-dependent hydrolase